MPTAAPVHPAHRPLIVWIWILTALIAATAVALVFAAGVPRLTCNGANPLTLPVPLDGPARFTGAAWLDLDAASNAGTKSSRPRAVGLRRA